jgi:uncharacterized protein YjbJ (UPF0337 family)
MGERTDGLGNQIKGGAKEVAGKVREEIGDATDKHSEELKGKAQKLEGKVQKKVGDAEIRDANRRDRI